VYLVVASHMAPHEPQRNISIVPSRGDPCGRPERPGRPAAADDQTSCIILAGGRSTRMGSNKAFLPLPGKERLTFIEHLVSTLTALCSETILVARDAADAANYVLPGVRVVTDKAPDQGPLMGLYSGLSAIHTQRALVVAVDMPFILPALVTFLLSQPQSDSLLVPLVNNVPQVLLALYTRTILPLIEQLLQQGRHDPRSLLDAAPVQYIEETQLCSVDPDLRSFININTPEELDARFNQH
jgi:molybdenum cofactor guanylyltransferase